jgi:hypothetical protein
MSDFRNRSITPSKGGGVFNDLAIRIKLILRLLGDGRVSPLLKLLPIGSLVYLAVPDLAPGPLDDAAIIWLGTYLFVELCPPDVVQEHMKSLQRVIPSEWNDPVEKADDIIDAEYTEEEENKS